MIVPMSDGLITQVIDALPDDVKKLLILYPRRIGIAGGFIRSLVQGEQPNDIDLFISDDGVIEGAKAYLSATRKITLESRNAITFSRERIQGPWVDSPVQIVTRWQYTPMEHIERFDFTICQAVVFGTDMGTFKGLQAEWFVQDSQNKKLVYTRPEREEEPLGSMHRAIKFSGKGYTLSGEQFARLAERMVFRVIRMSEEEDLELFTHDDIMNAIWRTWSWRAGRGSG